MYRKSPYNISIREGFGKLNKNCTVKCRGIYVDRGSENKILDLKISVRDGSADF
jgi:Zn-finger nucleic acid-binding protein